MDDSINDTGTAEQKAALRVAAADLLLGDMRPSTYICAPVNPLRTLSKRELAQLLLDDLQGIVDGTWVPDEASVEASKAVVRELERRNEISDEPAYRCTECRAEFTEAEAGDFCAECGNDFLCSIEGWDEIMGDEA